MTFIQGEGVAMDIYSSDLHLVFRMWATQLKETSTSSGATVLYCMWSCGPETSLVYMWPTFWVYVYHTTKAMSFTPQFPLEPGTVLFSRSGISWPTFTAFVGSDQLPSFKPPSPPSPTVNWHKMIVCQHQSWELFVHGEQSLSVRANSAKIGHILLIIINFLYLWIFQVIVIIYFRWVQLPTFKSASEIFIMKYKLKDHFSFHCIYLLWHICSVLCCGIFLT